MLLSTNSSARTITFIRLAKCSLNRKYTYSNRITIMADLPALFQHFAENVAERAAVDLPTPTPKDGTFRKKVTKCPKMDTDQEVQFEKSFFKGWVLYQMMLAASSTAGQMMIDQRESAESKYQDIEDLERGGYVEDKVIADLDERTRREVGLTFDSIGFDGSFHQKAPGNPIPSGSNAPVSHNIPLKKVKKQGKFKGPNLPYFTQIINGDEGLIVAYDNLSPFEATRRSGGKGDDYPGLQFWSDVAYLQWKMRTSSDCNLEYVLRYNVTNGFTADVVEAINLTNKTETLVWPGISYDAAYEEGQALLGTPNGSSVVFLLIQHKEGLGHKIVDHITVFSSAGGDLMLLFHIVDVAVTSAHKDEEADKEEIDAGHEEEQNLSARIKPGGGPIVLQR
jgi:hypothetical protein